MLCRLTKPQIRVACIASYPNLRLHSTAYFLCRVKSLYFFVVLLTGCGSIFAPCFSYRSHAVFREDTSKILDILFRSLVVAVEIKFPKNACSSRLFALNTMLCMDFDKSYMNLFERTIFRSPKVFNWSTFWASALVIVAPLCTIEWRSCHNTCKSVISSFEKALVLSPKALK